MLLLRLHADQGDAAPARGRCRGAQRARRRGGGDRAGRRQAAVLAPRPDHQRLGRLVAGRLARVQRRHAGARPGEIARPGVVAVGDQELPYGRLAVATGSSASIPPIPGLDSVEYWTNREATRTHEVPESIAIVGAGPVGCEFAQLFSRLGSQVAVVDVADRLLPSVDEEAGRMLAEALEAEGVALHLGGGIAGSSRGPSALERRPDPGAAAADRRRAASADRRAGPGAARRRDLEARCRGRRADARRTPRVGDRRRHRHRHVHPRRQVPRADRRGRHGR